jgi:hypothetical protein
MMKMDIIEFLEKRGFIVQETEGGFNIEIGYRSIGAGLNEIFIESDELDAIERLGNLAKIIYGDNIIRLNVRTESVKTDNRKKATDQKDKEIPTVEERVQAKIEEKGKGNIS